jgi:16S rRNA (guanine(966)-N(2))-methyltransferase RsmD
MKVRGGKYSGARLKMAAGRRIRPATSRVKTAIFDILPMDLSGASVLDLFAGSGSLGIEALSRGARDAVFADRSRKAGELIRANLSRLGCLARGEVMVKKAGAAINSLALQAGKFHLVFIDPPFDEGLAGSTLDQLAASGILADGAIVVVRTSTREKLEDSYKRLWLKERRKYGDSVVLFYRFSGGAEKSGEG